MTKRNNTKFLKEFNYFRNLSIKYFNWENRINPDVVHSCLFTNGHPLPKRLVTAVEKKRKQLETHKSQFNDFCTKRSDMVWLYMKDDAAIYIIRSDKARKKRGPKAADYMRVPYKWISLP